MPEVNSDCTEAGRAGKKSWIRRCCAPLARLALVLLALAGCSLIALEATEPLAEPSACAACHEMGDVHERWAKSPHHDNPSGITVTCIECHLPPREDHIRHLSSKAWAGAKDVYVHLFGQFDAEAARQTVRDTMPDQRCIRCHDNLLVLPSSQPVGIVHGISLQNTGANRDHACVVCHSALHSPRPAPPERKYYEEADNSYCGVCHVDFLAEKFVQQHLAAGISCDRCHGESEKHADDEEHLTPPETMFPKAQINASCMTAKCHTEEDMRKATGHIPWYAGAQAGKEYCTDCHGQHFLEVRRRKWDKATGKLIYTDGSSVGGMDGGGMSGP